MSLDSVPSPDFQVSSLPTELIIVILKLVARSLRVRLGPPIRDHLSSTSSLDLTPPPSSGVHDFRPRVVGKKVRDLDRAWFASLSLICWQWKPLVDEVLLYRIQLDEEKAFQRFSNMILQNPIRGERVRELVLGGIYSPALPAWEMLPRVLDVLSNLELFAATSDSEENQKSIPLSNFAKSLVIKPWIHSELLPRRLLRKVPSLGHLRELTIAGVSHLNLIKAWSQFDMDEENISLDRSSQLRLHHLDLNIIGSFQLEQHSIIEKVFQPSRYSLESLAISGANPFRSPSDSLSFFKMFPNIKRLTLDQPGSDMRVPLLQRLVQLEIRDATDFIVNFFPEWDELQELKSLSLYTSYFCAGESPLKTPFFRLKRLLFSHAVLTLEDFKHFLVAIPTIAPSPNQTDFVCHSSTGYFSSPSISPLRSPPLIATLQYLHLSNIAFGPDTEETISKVIKLASQSLLCLSIEQTPMDPSILPIIPNLQMIEITPSDISQSSYQKFPHSLRYLLLSFHKSKPLKELIDSLKNGFLPGLKKLLLNVAQDLLTDELDGVCERLGIDLVTRRSMNESNGVLEGLSWNDIAEAWRQEVLKRRAD